MNAIVRVGDIGVVLDYTIFDENGEPYDISTATTKTLIILKSDGSRLVKEASFSTDGKDGRLKYLIQAGDLNTSGTWKVQSHTILANGNERYGGPAEFEVGANL